MFFFFYIDTKFMLLCYSNNVLKCELVGYEAVNFYKSFKKWQYDVIICVIRWGVVDVFQGTYAFVSWFLFYWFAVITIIF